jgi:sulfur carrier protein ThiS
VRVTVVLFGHYARLLEEGRRGRATVDVADGSTAADVLDALGVPPEARSYLVADGERIKADRVLGDGSELRVVVPLGGG